MVETQTQRPVEEFAAVRATAQTVHGYISDGSWEKADSIVSIIYAQQPGQFDIWKRYFVDILHAQTVEDLARAVFKDESYALGLVFAYATQASSLEVEKNVGEGGFGPFLQELSVLAGHILAQAEPSGWFDEARDGSVTQAAASFFMLGVVQSCSSVAGDPLPYQ